MTYEDSGAALNGGFLTKSPCNYRAPNLSYRISSGIDDVLQGFIENDCSPSPIDNFLMCGVQSYNLVPSKSAIPSPSLSLTRQLNFDNLQAYLSSQSKKHGWKFDDEVLHDAIVSGCYLVNERELLDSFFDWHSLERVTVLSDLDGNQIKLQAPRRGNYSYARKKKRVRDYLDDGIKKLKLWWPVGGRSKLFYTHMILFTLTFLRLSDPYDKQRQWQNLTNEVAKFRYKLSRSLGISISSFTVKEGCADGYPAPHVLIMFDRPLLVYRHVSRSGEVS